MKKITLLFAAALAFAACQKESVKDNAPVSASEIVFNLDVNYASDTKAVKTAFTEGDKLFIFFEGVTSGYFTSVSDANGVFASAQLNGTVTVNDLAESGKSLTAVFLPYGNDATPSYGSNWTFDKGTDSFFLAANSPYTLTKASGIATLSATLTMAAPSNYVQFFVPDVNASGSIKLACNAVTPSGLASISANGTVTEVSSGTQGAFMTAYAATVGSDKGYYASGKLAATPGTEYYIAIEEGSKYSDYGIHTNSALANNAAIKLSAINEVGPQKYTKNKVGGKTWATVNVGASKPWQYETPQHKWKGENNSDWTMIASGEGMPEKTDFEALVNNCHHSWISIAGVKGYIVIDNAATPTGGYMFLPASGWSSDFAGISGRYWSRTESTSTLKAWSLYFSSSGFSVGDFNWNVTYSVRPLQNS